MTKIRLKQAITELGGTVYEVELKLSRQEEISETKRPRTKRHGQFQGKATEAQRAQRQRFKLAMEYARAALANSDLRVVYEELGAQAGKGAFAAARDDYFKGNDLLSTK